MYKRQMKAQKILSYLLIAVAAVLFVATLGMSTDLYEILYPCYEPPKNNRPYKEYVKGAKLYADIQDFNKLAVRLAIVLIVVSLLMFISCSHTRRKYYLFNYIATGIVAAVFIALSAYILIGVLDYKNKFLTQVDFEQLKAYAEGEGKDFGAIYSKSTFWLDFNIFGCVLVIVSAILAVLNAVWKFILERNEKNLLNQGINAEVA